MAKTGTSFTAVNVNRNVASAEVSSPLLAVPPSSDRVTVTRQVPFLSAAGVKLRLPVPVFTAGCTLNNVVSPAATVNVSTSDVSLACPTLMDEAQPVS